MSATIDERVVEMRFDNKDFEKNVGTTMSTLEKLKQKLNFSGASKGLEDINKAAKNTNINGVAAAVETVNAKFSALQVMGVTALANITNSVVNAGKRITKALTIDRIKTGFQEYETQINAVQTILSNTRSKGTTLEDVNKALDELNGYADKTIYNFTEMTRNIGTFTAAGIDLDKSVTAIQGIANLAAVSGSTSQQASTAMYQLSQALSSGTVKLMDWNSVVNAGMGGQVFQDALKETARVHGVKIDEMIKKQGSFRETLKDEWLTAEILTETLEKFTMTTEGLTEAQIEQNKAMLKSKGYTDDQIKAIFALGEDATNAATKVKTFTQLFDTLGESVQSGWTQTWEILVGDFEEAKTLLTGISNAIGSIIETTSEKRNRKLEKAFNGPEQSWEKLTEKIKKAGVSTNDFQKEIIKTAKKHGINVNKMIKKEGSFEKTLASGWMTKEMVIETLHKYSEGTAKAGKSTEDMEDKLKKFQKVVDRVWNGDFKNGKERIEALTKAGYNYSEVQALVNKTVDGHKLTLSDLSDVQLKSVGYTDEQIKKLRELEEQARKTGTPVNELIEDISKPSGRFLLIDSFKNLVEYFKEFATIVKEAWNEIFPESEIKADSIYGLIEQFHELTSSMTFTEDQAKNLKGIIEGLFAGFDLMHTVISWSILGGLKILNAVLELFGENILTVCEKIAQYIVKVRDWVKENTIFIGHWKKIGEALYNIIKGIRDCVIAFAQLETVNKVLKTVKDAVVKIFEALHLDFGGTGFDTFIANIEKMFDNLEKWIKNLDSAEWFQAGLDVVTGLVNGLASGVSKVIETISNIAQTLIDKFCELLGINSPSKVFIALGAFIVMGLATGITGKAGEVLDSIKALAGNIIDVVADILQNGLPFVVDLVKAIGNSIKTGFQDGDFDIGSIAVFASLIGVFFLMKKLIDVAEAFSNPFKKLGGFFGELKDAVEAVKDSIVGFMKAKKFTLYADAVKSIAISVGILAAALYLISNIETDKLLRSAGVLAGLCAALVIMAKLTQNANPVAFGKLSVMMLAMGMSLLLMSKAVDRIASIEDPEKATNAILGIVNLMMGMTVLITTYGALVKSDVSANIKKVGLMLIKMASAILILAFVIKMLSGMEQSDIDRGMSNIAGIMVLFGLFTAASTFAGEHASKAGAMLLKMSIAIGLMVLVVKTMGGVTGGELAKGMIFITGVMLLFGGVVAVSKFAGIHASKAGGMILKMSLAITILAGTIKLIASIPDGDILKGMYVISSMMEMFAVFMALSLFVGSNAGKAGTMLMGMALAIGVMSLSLKLLATMNDADITRGFTIITGISTLFAAFIAVSMFAGQHADKAGTMLLKMSVAMLILTASIAVLSILKEEDVWSAVGAVSAVMVLFGMLVAVSKLATDQTKSLTMLVVSFGAIAASIAILSALKPDKIKNAATCLSMVVGMFAVLVAASKLATGSIGALVVMTVALGIMAGVFVLLNHFEVDNALSTAGAISLLLLSLSASFLLMAALSGVIPAALTGVLAFGALVVELGAVLAILGGLSKIPGVQEIIADGGNFLQTIGTAIGQFVGGIAGGIAQGFTSSLPQIGSDLSGFMTNAKPFFEGIKTIDSSMLTSVQALADMILTLTGANLIDGLASWLTGEESLTKFAEGLVPFGKSMKQYSESVKGIDANAVTASATAGKALAELGKALPNSGGLVSLFSGDNKLGDFASQLVPFGKGMKQYSDAVVGIDASAVNKSANSAKKLSKMMNDIADARTGNVLSFSTALKKLGETNIDSFVDAFYNADSKLKTATTTLINTVVSTIESKKEEMANVARGLISKFCAAIENCDSQAKTAIKAMLRAADTAIDSFKEDFKSSGKDLGTGLIEGIESKYQSAYWAGYTLGQQAVQGEKDGQQSNSPSKLTKQAGVWLGEGLIVGIKQMGKKVYNAGHDIGDTAAKSMTNAVSRISSVLDSDMDVNPTIRPVLDLSDVRSGVGAIGNMLDIGSSVGVSTNIGDVNAAMSRLNQNGTNAEIVSAINKLRKDLGNVGNTSYNINGITYDDGSNISDAVQTLVRAARVGRRV